jgi:hypothetical protein
VFRVVANLRIGGIQWEPHRVQALGGAQDVEIGRALCVFGVVKAGVPRIKPPALAVPLAQQPMLPAWWQVRDPRACPFPIRLA